MVGLSRWLVGRGGKDVVVDHDVVMSLPKTTSTVWWWIDGGGLLSFPNACQFSENSHKGIVGNIADLNGRLSLRADRARRISENLTKFAIMLAGNFPLFLAPFLERRRRRTIFNEGQRARDSFIFYDGRIEAASRTNRSRASIATKSNCKEAEQGRRWLFIERVITGPSGSFD